MTKVRVKASAENVNNALEDRGDFALAPPGYYVMKVVEANAGFSKGDDGEEDPKRPRVEVICDYVAKGKERAELDANYGRVWHYVSFSKESGDSRANFIRAFWPDEVVPGKELDFEFDTDDLVEREFMARIKHEVDKFKTNENKASTDPKVKKEVVKRARIARFFTLDDDSFTEAEDATDAYASATEGGEEANPFEENQLLTQEELEAMDIKEIGAVAKEFDLNPDDLLVLNRAKKVDLDKTKAAVIAAILEAQGADDQQEEDTAGGDESPF